MELTKERVTTAFVDGDRGGELILKELLQTADIDFVARAPQTREVEEIPQKLIMKALKNKIPAEQYAEMFDIKVDKKEKQQMLSSHAKDTKKEHKRGMGKSINTESMAKKIDNRIITDKQKSYGKILDDIRGSLKAVLFDKNDKEIKKIPVRELTDALKKSNNITTVVFDGIITQRLVDIANNKNVNEIVGMKMGNVVKMPANVRILTKKDIDS